MKVELILDSKIGGERVTLFRVTYPRIVHSEFLRHRSFSLCSSSSRAIPLDRMIEQYTNFYPTKWRKHQSGMQPDESFEFSEETLKEIDFLYEDIRIKSIETAKTLHELGVAKEQVNRLIEPYSYITHLVQGTESTYRDFFKLRCHPTAQYEIRELALEMERQYNESVPVKRNYHVPFIENVNLDVLVQEEMKFILDVASARCARTSYYNHDGGKPDRTKDEELAKQLLKDKHMSPFEFCVFDHYWFYKNLASEELKIKIDSLQEEGLNYDFSGNLRNENLVQYRKMIEL